MSQKEIDLIDLFNKFFSFILKNFWILLIFGLVGAGIGYGYSKMQKPTYSTTGIFSTWLEEDLLVKLLDVMEHQIIKGNQAFLCKNEEFPVELTKQIFSIEFKLPDVKTKAGSEHVFFEKRNNVLIEIFSHNASSIKGFETCIINHFNNNVNLQKLFLQRRKMLENLIQQIDYEIEFHKEMNTSLADNSKAKNSFIYIDYKVKDILDLIKLKCDIEYELSSDNLIFFTQDFTSPAKMKKSLIKHIVLFSALFLIIGMILLSFKKGKKKIK
jgi:hypothetical protein